jgi:hypothetical protein
MARVPLLVACALLAACARAPDTNAVENASAVTSAPFAGEPAFAIDTHPVTGGQPSWVTAYWGARLSRLAYEPEETIRGELSRVGAHGDVTFFENARADVQGYVLVTGPAVVVVFRGTDDMADLLTDLECFLVTTAYGGVHRGFEQAFESVWPDGADGLDIHGAASAPGLGSLVRKAMSEAPGRALITTGHSLGGALATLTAMHVAYGCELASDRALSDTELAACPGARADIQAVYTFGAPRAGDKRFAALAGNLHDATHTRRMFRVTYGSDAIPSVPGFAGYTHPFDLVDDESRLEVKLDSVEDVAFPFVNDHLTMGYIAALRKRVEGH